jgi:hypothetical protein
MAVRTAEGREFKIFGTAERKVRKPVAVEN